MDRVLSARIASRLLAPRLLTPRLLASRRTGETLHLSDGLPPRAGFAVGREGWELRMGGESSGLRALYAAWVDRVMECKELHPNADWAVGVWYDRGYVYLDVVDVILDRDEAIRLGRDRSQLAIYDLGLGQCIDLCREPAGDPFPICATCGGLSCPCPECVR